MFIFYKFKNCIWEVLETLVSLALLKDIGFRTTATMKTNEEKKNTVLNDNPFKQGGR